MGYAAQQDLIDRFGGDELAQLSKRNDGQIDADAVARAIEDATVEIDSYLAVRYSLPLPLPVAPLLNRLCCDIARYRLYDQAVTDLVRTRYEDAVALLKRLSAGDVQLGMATAETPPAQTSELVYHRFAPRAITDDALRGF